MLGAVFLFDHAQGGVPGEALAEQGAALHPGRHRLELMGHLVRHHGERHVDSAWIAVRVEQGEQLLIPDGGGRGVQRASRRRVLHHPDHVVRKRSETLGELLERRLHAADHARHVRVVRGMVEDFDGDIAPTPGLHRVVGGEDGVAVPDGRGRLVPEVASAVLRPRTDQLTWGEGDLVFGCAHRDRQIDVLHSVAVRPGLDVVQRRKDGPRRQAVLPPLDRIDQLSAKLIADERHPVLHREEAPVPDDGGADVAGREAARSVAHLPLQPQRFARLERLVQHVDTVAQNVVEAAGAGRTVELDRTCLHLGGDRHVERVHRQVGSVHEVMDAADVGLATVGV